MIEKDIWYYLSHKKAILIFSNIEDGIFQYKLYKCCEGISYTYLVKNINYFKELNLIILKNSGKTKLIYLTKKGKELQNIFIELKKYFEKLKEEK